MATDILQARETIRRCREFRDAGKPEAVLRSEIQSRLRLIFLSPEDETWINHYNAGAEAHTRITTSSGKSVSRFIDNLVGSTTIEYEADLRVPAKRDEGFRQVKEHAAGLIRSGVRPSQVRGILSDTVDWYAYDISLTVGVSHIDCTTDAISLRLVDQLQLAGDDDGSAQLLIAFLRKHLAREQSRPLMSELLVLDMGLDSGPCLRSADPLLKMINDGRATDPSIALATDLWSEFVDHLAGDVAGFRASAYTDEVYLCVLSRLLSANVLAEEAVLSNEDELKAILNGSYFRDRYQLENMVELDYFGWLVGQGNIDKLVPVAKEIQLDLYAYDFSWRPEEDLFGRLMAQLARRSQRKLLGQEWTPSWVGHLLAERCIDALPPREPARIVDMCCGSGSILAEVLKVAREHLGLIGMEALHDVATGFDIDPLAVSLAKTTWVVTLAKEIKSATRRILIPIYHADSLFAVTPVSSGLPALGEDQPIYVSLDGATVKLPHALVQPEYRELFDRIVDWAYDEACDAQSKGSTSHLSPENTTKFIHGAAAASGNVLPDELLKDVAVAVYSLVHRMAELAVTNRNGIWAFILKNTYRPGLLSGQFNGLVSNPPWLAMSGLADNPYRAVLTTRANLYGIRPAGSSFLHLELGTTHLLHAVDRYLKTGASVACLVPGTVFNGNHHERFRQREFLKSTRAVALEIEEVWQIEPGTFKYPGAAIVGHKRDSVVGLQNNSIDGFVAMKAGLEKAEFSVRTIGNQRSAWVLEKEGLPVAAGGMKELPQQGADLMPRTAVCIDILSEAGVEFRVDTPTKGSTWAFTVKAAKELKDARFPGYAAPRFIARIAQSENLLPFLFGDHSAPLAIPAGRDAAGVWKIFSEAEIRGMGLTQTARRFQEINIKLHQVGKGKSLQQRIDERGKLIKQIFGDNGYLLLAGAGGKYICAACLPVSSAQNLVVDQTIYWKLFANPDEAWFCVGMLNSPALTDAIAPFNPKGAFGERHVHALPYRLIPVFDSSNDEHRRIAELALSLATLARTIVASDSYLGDPNRALTQRRSKLRGHLLASPDGKELGLLCAALLGTSTAAGGHDT